jgi:hypothetical protein
MLNPALFPTQFGEQRFSCRRQVRNDGSVGARQRLSSGESALTEMA